MTELRLKHSRAQRNVVIFLLLGIIMLCTSVDVNEIWTLRDLQVQTKVEKGTTAIGANAGPLVVRRNDTEMKQQDSAMKPIGRHDTAVTISILNKTVELPRTLKICDYHTLEFNQSLVLPKYFRNQFVLPSHPAHIGYAPWLTKCGSTKFVQMLDHLFGTDFERLQSLPEDQSNFTLISFIRHPLKRALAGYHQFELFMRKGWIEGTIAPLMTYHKLYCLDSLWGCDSKGIKSVCNCTGSEPSNSNKSRIRRLNGFLDDIQRIGFVDQHITPLSLQLQAHPARNPLIFDINDIMNVSNVLSVALNRPLPSDEKPMSRNTTARDYSKPYSPSDGKAWMVLWDELLFWKEDMPEAAEAIRKLCHLYRQDVDCFSEAYNIPECNNV
jgi:hypothetical protein